MEQQMQNYIEAGINERERCYNEITELEHLRDKYKELYESSMLSEATTKQYAEEVDKQNQELAAQVEVLKEALKPAVRLMRATGQYSGWHEKADEAESLVNRELTTQQHLAEIRAQAVDDCRIIVERTNVTYRESPGMGFSSTIEDRTAKDFKTDVSKKLSQLSHSIRRGEVE